LEEVKMSKRKTSKKRKFSWQDIPTTGLTNIKGLSRLNTREILMDKDFISKALWESLVMNDVEAFKEILKGYLEFMNKENLVKETGLSRRTLYRMLSSEGNPSLENISKIIHKLCA
jgi:DNA-binding phage protein